MTTVDTEQTNWRDSILPPWIVLGVGSTLVGGLVLLMVEGFETIAVPLDDVSRHSIFGSISLLPQWVDPVTLSLEALVNLRLSVLVLAVSIWLLPGMMVGLVAGIYWWISGSDTSGFVPPVPRLGWLMGVICVLSLAPLGFNYVVGTDPIWFLKEFYLFEYLGIGPGAVELLCILPIALIVGQLFVAPVTMILDGRRPIAAIQWSIRSIYGAGAMELATILVLSLAFGWYIVPVPFDVIKVGFEGTVLAGTAVMGAAHTVAMLLLYNIVDDDQTAAS